MDFKAENINWNTPAGKELDRLAGLLPKQPRLDITVFGSAPLQMLLDPSFLSQDIDVFSPEEAYAFLSEFVAAEGLGQGEAKFYIQVCSPFAFRSALDWRSRAIEAERNGHLFRF